MTRKQYKKPPIVEAVCEIQFEESSSWDLAIPGLVYEKVRNTFPIRRQAARVTVNITNTSGEIGPQFGTVQFMQFLRQDEKALIQVGPQIISVNVLKPYPSWQRFLPLIRKGVVAYRDVVAPTGIQRIGLRYINHIEIPGLNIKLEDYLEFRPFLGPNLPQDYSTFAVSTQIPYENSRDALSLQLASLPQPDISEDKATIVLSLDYFLLKPKEIALDGAFEWVETAHQHIEDSFEACITQKMRHLFKER